MAHSLRLIEHDLAAGRSLSLPGAVRVLFAADEGLTVRSAAVACQLPRETAWHGADDCVVEARAPLARLLRFELVRQPPPGADGGRVLLEHPMAMKPGGRYLIRCDRVDFAPGGVAPPHRHRGGGIRRLLRGALTVTVGDSAPRTVSPGDPWYESGREPVLAVAADLETSFVRVSILPAEIRGASSIVYVDPADATRAKPRSYTVYVDSPIHLY